MKNINYNKDKLFEKIQTALIIAAYLIGFSTATVVFYIAYKIL